MNPPGFRASSQRVGAALILAATVVYLAQFVTRGWVPLDEGMTGQAAERVLRGELPHVAYEEPYPGALSRLYALVFKIAGVDLASLRWVVFAAALGSIAFIYSILRRYLDPVYAALGTLLAVVWSFPNYFSSLPSWWLLLCGLLALWALVRYFDTGRLAFAFVAGLSAGTAFCIKQTGVYFLPPLVMALAIGPRTNTQGVAPRRFDTAIRGAVAVAAFLVVLLIMRSGLGSGELVYLVVPVAASCLAFILAGAGSSLDLRAASIAVAGTAAPILLLLLPYMTSGHVRDFLNGVFVLPQRRLLFATLPMPPATQMMAAAVALTWILWSPRSLKPAELRVVEVIRWILALVLIAASLRWRIAYTFVWEAVRGAAALMPLVACWLLGTNRVNGPNDRRILFAVSALLAWASLSQFPFAAPIYFCYVAPLALIAAVIVVRSGSWLHRLDDRPALVVALLFALLCLNRGYVWNVGAFHQVQDLSHPLDLARAHLSVEGYEANVYRRVVPLVEQHLGARGVVAGPDAPEIYFLTGQFSRSGRLFDFFSTTNPHSEAIPLEEWRTGDVIVLYHGERFSPPLSATLISSLRSEFPHGESVPPFEVRWR